MVDIPFFLKIIGSQKKGLESSRQCWPFCITPDRCLLQQLPRSHHPRDYKPHRSVSASSYLWQCLLINFNLFWLQFKPMFCCPIHQIQTTDCPSLLNCNFCVWELFLCFLAPFWTETPYFPTSSLTCFLDLQILFTLFHIFPKAWCPTSNQVTQPRSLKDRGVWKDYFTCLKAYILFYTIRMVFFSNTT